jgi:hypothetical protein
MATSLRQSVALSSQLGSTGLSSLVEKKAKPKLEKPFQKSKVVTLFNGVLLLNMRTTVSDQISTHTHRRDKLTRSHN